MSTELARNFSESHELLGVLSKLSALTGLMTRYPPTSSVVEGSLLFVAGGVTRLSGSKRGRRSLKCDVKAALGLEPNNAAEVRDVPRRVAT